MSKFEGLCIGGPAAGRFVACESPRLVVPILDGDQPFMDSPNPTFTALVYKHEPVRMPDGEVGFWLPPDRDAKWAFWQMMAAYVAANDNEMPRQNVEGVSA